MKNRKVLTVLLASVLFSASASAQDITFDYLVDLVFNSGTVTTSTGDGKPDPIDGGDN